MKPKLYKIEKQVREHIVATLKRRKAIFFPADSLPPNKLCIKEVTRNIMILEELIEKALAPHKDIEEYIIATHAPQRLPVAVINLAVLDFLQYAIATCNKERPAQGKFDNYPRLYSSDISKIIKTYHTDNLFEGIFYETE